MTIATIDIGGTGIKFASLTPDGKILDKASTPTPKTLEDLLAWLDQRLSERDFLISMVFHGMRLFLIISYLSI